MRIISFNVNGIRAAARKGFYSWLSRQRADVVCVQELKAQNHQLEAPDFWPKSFSTYYYPAERKGYSGVGIYSRAEPDEVITGFGVEEFDNEGRYLEARYDGLSIISLYLPSGSSGPERQESKDRFLDVFPPHLEKLKHERDEVILCGDWNIAHREIDLKNWKSNQKNSGFLPHERAWMDKLFAEFGYQDAYRIIEPDTEQYTWWSNRGRARENNVGWRIDYQVITPGLADKVQKARVYRDKWFSDHAPLIMDYQYDL
ncbi:MAG: exodeoxyribonuclease III [Gammaproteobacteria bacterium]|nr:MAG: exodeoxyribonuclease III [Gammaproteobacteria bacterium]